MVLAALIRDFLGILVEFLYAPLIFRELLWILLPVIAAIIFMEFYFFKYPRMSIGHHKSLENTIFLIFILFDLVRYSLSGHYAFSRIAVVVVFFAFSIFVGIQDYRHRLPTSAIYGISSKLIISFFAYISIVLVYSDMLDSFGIIRLISIVLSVLLLFFIILTAKKIFFYLEPRSYEEMEQYLRKIEDDIEKSVKESDSKLRESIFKKGK